MNSHKNSADRRDGFDRNQLGSSVDLTGGGDFPLGLAMGLAPAALAAAGVGLGLASAIQARRQAREEDAHDAFLASQTCTITTNAAGDPVAVEGPQEPEVAVSRHRSPYGNILAFPTPRPKW